MDAEEVAFVVHHAKSNIYFYGIDFDVGEP
jgi:hypothetical protein